MTDDKKANVEVKIDLPIIKVTVSTEVFMSEIEKTVEHLVDSISKVNKKLVKLAEVPEGLPRGVQLLPTTPIQAAIPEEPLNNIAMRLEIDANSLRSANLLGIKNEKVQIFKPQKFTTQEATLVLAFSYEAGLKRQSITYEELKMAYQDSGIKGKTPFRMVIVNLKNAGYIDKQKYDSPSKEIVLTAKGTEKAIEYIKKAVSS